ncbi:RNA polymerase sigma factor [Streptosporangium sp. NPDC087985]|uniref:RNA polymerase sigma factor n=1 Tax=Streptosporangium sp. NPDC087985 TaxID=3366196 RepID=UPI003803EFD8
MPPPLLGQRMRGELIAELYDRHAAGLFAYCHDQLGDSGSAAAALVAVFATVPDVEPPRAALYAVARREIYLRDVVYSPPSAGADPVAAFVERVLRDLRPHQREVLYLSGMCQMDTAELSWVLDVAADTADELTVSACRRFAQSLNLALASARVPDHLTDVFGALPVAPVRDVLVRAPWATPPAALRAAALGPRPGTASAASSPILRVKPLWPTTPAWPLPLTGTGAGEPSPSEGFPDPFSFRDLDVLSAHEATTEPMPQIRDAVLTALDDVLSRPRRPRLQRPRPRPRGAAPLPTPTVSPLASPAAPPPSTPTASPSAAPTTPPFLAAPLPADILDDVLDEPPAESLFRPRTPEAPAALLHTDKLVASAPRAEPVPAPGSAPGPETDTPGGAVTGGAGSDAETAQAVLLKRADRPTRRRPRPTRKERHHDWMWELIGFLICVAIAMLVFFVMPTR